MNKSIITNWDNDLLEAPDRKVVEFAAKKYKHHELKYLPGLRQRDIQEIYDSIRESRVIIIEPHILESEQIATIVSAIAHPIHVNQNGATRNYEIRDFVFLSMNPYEDLKKVVSAASALKDSHGEYSLSKILYNCEAHFYGYDGEHYELVKDGSFGSTKVLRYS